MNDQSSVGPRKPIQLVSTLALKQVIENMEWTIGGSELRTSFSPTNLLLDQLRSGERADVVLLTKEGVLKLTDEKILRPGCLDIAISTVGIVQAKGTQDLDISTVGKLREVLINAKSIAYSANGASGIFFADLIRRLEIEQLVQDKAVISLDGFTGEFVANGQAEIAVQQVSELRSVSGLGTITLLPDDAQSRTVFTAASVAKSPNMDALQTIVSRLKSDNGIALLRAVGLEPIRMHHPTPPISRP